MPTIGAPMGLFYDMNSGLGIWIWQSVFVCSVCMGGGGRGKALKMELVIALVCLPASADYSPQLIIIDLITYGVRQPCFYWGLTLTLCYLLFHLDLLCVTFINTYLCKI